MTIRGQKLLVRQMEAADQAALRRLKGPDFVPPSHALIGKLLGDIVTYLAFTPADSRLRIDEIFVTTDLQRKRIGRAMVRELGDLAREFHCATIVVSAECEAREFFLKMGFTETEGLLQQSIEDLGRRG